MGVLAMYYVQKTLDANRQELLKPRDTDMWLIQAEEVEDHRTELYKQGTVFEKFPVGTRMLLVAALVFVASACYLLFVPMGQHKPFKSFDMTDNEDDFKGSIHHVVNPA